MNLAASANLLKTGANSGRKSFLLIGVHRLRDECTGVLQNIKALTVYSKVRTLEVTKREERHKLTKG